MSTTYAPLPADLLTCLDAFGGEFKLLYGAMATTAAKITTDKAAIIGDGTASNPGIANTRLKYLISPDLDNLESDGRYDLYFRSRYAFLQDLDNLILDNLPSYVESGVTKKWSFSGLGQRPLDMHLCRYNANHAYAPDTPTGTPTLTATSGGSIPTTATGRRVKIALVGDADWKESQPGAASLQVAITGNSSAYLLGALPAGNVPAGVYKLRIYSQAIGAAVGDAYGFLKDVTVTPGVAWNTYSITITEPDSAIDFAWQPASFAAYLMLPETAAVVALSLGIHVTGTQGVTLIDRAMLSPSNVVLNPSDGFLSINQAPLAAAPDGVMATYTQGSGLLAGVRRTASSTSLALQGFTGATKLQARVTSLLNAPATLTNVAITYVNAANPLVAQATTIAGPFNLAAAVGSEVEVAGLPAGSVVKSVTAINVAGIAAGTFVLEAKEARAI